MNCETVCEKLSAYLDGELPDIEELQVQNHTDSCAGCRVQLEQFVAISGMIRRCEAANGFMPSWESFEHQLDRRAVELKSRSIYRSKRGLGVLATAASFAILWLAISNARNSNLNDRDVAGSFHAHSSMAVDFQDVFKLAQTEPQQAIGRLAAKYQGKELDRDGTIDYLGYEPTLFQRLPTGFTRTSTHVLNMPCCKCSASICERIDRTSLIVFEHKDEQPVWFGDLPSIETQCSGKICKIIEAAGQLAVSWKNDDRQLTMIGANDISEVNQWVASTLKL
ncbi:MAG: zf-HC2 domain-containing protein [Pirellulaceae bacterium]|nr:zf-HC2 domain-containing protein [Pirellulaceae bacterium]